MEIINYLLAGVVVQVVLEGIGVALFVALLLWLFTKD